MNTDRGLLFLILSLTSIWLVFDDFFGGKRLSNLANMLTPGGGGLPEVPHIPLEDKEKAEENRVDGKKWIDKQNINPKAKGSIKEAIDHFYSGSTPS